MPRRRPVTRVDRDRGSAVVEFVLVTPILMLVALAVLGVVLVFDVRATLTSAAAEGARAASLAGSDPVAGVARTRSLVDGTLAGAVVTDVTARRGIVDGLPVVVVRVTATVPFGGLLGPATVTVEGRALEESWT
jgi:Flp pilus assembly protein TadG